MAAAVFISYSRRDREFVGALSRALTTREYAVWVDEKDIPATAEWRQEIDAGIAAADAFLFVISPDSIASEVCGRELDIARERGKRIIPILHRDPGDAPVPDPLEAIQYVTLRDDDDLAAGVARLAAAVETDLDHVQAHTRLGLAAARWVSGGVDSSRLLRGHELADAEAWLVAGAGRAPEATQLQRRFLLAGRQAATRRQRTVIGAVGTALAIAIALAVVALVQRASAITARDLARARQYDAEAANLATTEPVVGLQLAIAAARLVPSSATIDQLRASIVQSHERVRYGLDTVPTPAGDTLWSPDGTRLLVTKPGAGGWARIYRPRAGATPVTLAGGAAPAVTGQSGWDARGDRVIIGGGRPAVYDAATGALVRRLPGTAVHAALTPDGTIAVTVDADWVGHAFDVATGRSLATFHPRFAGDVTCFALSPAGTVAAHCDTRSTHVLNSPADLDTWDVRTGRLIHSVPSASVITSVAFNPTGASYVFTTQTSTASTSLATEGQAAGRPGTLVYATDSGRLLISFPGGASAAAFGPSTTVPELAYATIGDDQGHVYDFLSHANLTLTGATDVIDTIAFSADGAYVIAAGVDDTARVYYAIDGGPAIETLAGDTDQIVEAGFGAGDAYIATAAGDGTDRLWAGPVPVAARVSAPAIAFRQTASLGYSSDGADILQAALGGQGRILDGATLSVRSTFRAPAGQGFAGAVLSGDGQTVAAVSDRDAQTVVLTEGESYDARTGRLIGTMAPVTPGPLANGKASADGTLLVTLGLNGAADEWDVRTGRLLHHLPGSGVAGSAAFSADGTQLAIAHYPPLPATVTDTTTFGPITIDVYDVRTGRLERSITGDTLVPQIIDTASYAPLTLAFSPGGRLLAVGGAAPDVEIYDPRTGARVAGLGLAGTSLGVYADALAFSPDGSMLAVGTATGASVWRVPAHGSAFEPLPVFTHAPAGEFGYEITPAIGVSVAFSADSRFLVSSGDLAVHVWDVASHLSLFDAIATRASLSPGGDEVAVAKGSAVELYRCDACGDLHQLLAVAARDSTAPLTPAERATYLSG
jgi:WD40 repeat protein